MDGPLDLKAAATVGMSNLGKLLAGHFAWRPSIYYVNACRGGGQKSTSSTIFILISIGREGGKGQNTLKCANIQYGWFLT